MIKKELFKMTDVNDIARSNREYYYKSESDQMFIMVQRGEITNDEWLAKIQEIKDRFPYVTEDLFMDIEYPEDDEEEEEEEGK
jgi:hypothetical protein